MALHPDFPTSPYAQLIPEQRWFPADETLRATRYDMLLPPLVAKVRREVFDWRGKGYPGASPTSAALLKWWFETDHLLENADGSLASFDFKTTLDAEIHHTVSLDGSGPDVQAFAKNYFAVGFKLDYVKADGDLSNYVPDFIVRDTSGVIWIIETKGRQELDLPQKMARLKQWCADATAAEENGQRYDFVFVDQQGFDKHAPKALQELVLSFTDFKQS